MSCIEGGGSLGVVRKLNVVDEGTEVSGNGVRFSMAVDMYQREWERAKGFVEQICCGMIRYVNCSCEYATEWS